MVLSTSLNHLLSMIDTYQILVLISLFNLIMPGNARIFFAQLQAIAAFELFDTNPFLDRYFGLAPSDPLNSSFEAVGFESAYFLHNLGTLPFAFVLYLLAVGFSFALTACQYPEIQVYGEILKKKLIWGTLIRIIFESFWILAVSSLINLKRLDWSTAYAGSMSLISMLVPFLLIGFIMGYAIYFKKQSMENKRTRHSEIYNQLDLRKGRDVLLQPFWFLVRRLLLALAVVFLESGVIWQISILTMTVIVQVIILGRVGPFREQSKNSFELFNECFVLVVMYHCICFTPFVPDIATRYYLGYLVIVVISIHMVINIVLIAKTMHRELHMMYRIWRAVEDF